MWRSRRKSIPTFRRRSHLPMWTREQRPGAEHVGADALVCPALWCFARCPDEASGPTWSWALESFVIRVLVAKHCVLGCRHWLIAFAIAPQDCIELRRIGRIGMGKIHLRGFARTLTLGRIYLIDQTVLAIAPVSCKGCLISCA